MSVQSGVGAGTKEEDDHCCDVVDKMGCSVRGPGEEVYILFRHKSLVHLFAEIY